MTSLSLLAPSDRKDEADAMLEALGRGPANFAVACSPTGADPASHYGCHSYDDELAAIFAAGDMPDWIEWHAVEDRESTANFEALCQRVGVTQVVVPEGV